MGLLKRLFSVPQPGTPPRQRPQLKSNNGAAFLLVNQNFQVEDLYQFITQRCATRTPNLLELDAFSSFRITHLAQSFLSDCPNLKGHLDLYHADLVEYLGTLVYPAEVARLGGSQAWQENVYRLFEARYPGYEEANTADLAKADSPFSDKVFFRETFARFRVNCLPPRWSHRDEVLLLMEFAVRLKTSYLAFGEQLKGVRSSLFSQAT